MWVKISRPSHWESVAGRQQTMAREEAADQRSCISQITFVAEAGAAAVLTNNTGTFCVLCGYWPVLGWGRKNIGESPQFLKQSECFPPLDSVWCWSEGLECKARTQDSHRHTAQAWVASLKIWLDAWQRSRPWLGIYRSMAWSSQWWTEKDWSRYEPSSCLARTRQQQNILIHSDFKSFSAALSQR